MEIAANILRFNHLIEHERKITLLAVSKGHSTQKIERAYAAGLTDFAESYVQEALVKIQALSALPLCWHFIGQLQSNKTQMIANHFSWVHSVDRGNIAQKLNDARLATKPPLNVCLQVNVDDEKKAGIKPADIDPLVSYILQLPRLRLRGLMVIPKQQSDKQQQYQSFLGMAQLLQSLNRKFNLTMDTLSMGMSGDYQSAIRAGSTMIRIGTAIFGERIRSRELMNHEN